MVGWHLRDAADGRIKADVYDRNEYELPGDMGGQRVLDVGGNIGCFARAALDRGARVLSVEPDPGNAQYYRRNLAEYDRDRWRLLEVALAHTDGTVKLYTGAGVDGYTTTKDMGCGHRLVPAVSFETLLGHAEAFWGAGRIDHAKVDAEGLEYSLLEHPDFLARIDCLSVEFHNHYVSFAIPRAHRARLALAGLGFREERWHEVEPGGSWYRLYRGRRDP